MAKKPRVHKWNMKAIMKKAQAYRRKGLSRKMALKQAWAGAKQAYH